MTRRIPTHTLLALFAALAVFLAFLPAALAQGAGDPADSSALARLAVIAIQILEPIVLAVGTFLAAKLTFWLKARWDIDVPDKVEDRIDKWVAEGVSWAEEEAREQARQKLRRIRGDEKLEMAADFVLDQARERGFVGWTRKTVEKKVRSYLNKHRNDLSPKTLGEGSTGD